MRIKRGKFVWIGLGLFAILLRWLASSNPSTVEQVYSRGIYIGIRKVFDLTIRFIPMPFVYLVLLGLFAYAIYGLIWLFRSKEKWGSKLVQSVVSLLALVGGISFFFLFLWGYNYARVPLKEQLALETTPLSKSDIELELAATAALVDSLRSQIGTDSIAIKEAQLPTELSQFMIAELQSMLAQLDYPSRLSPKVQQLRPQGILLRFQTLGVYFPWTGECNLDAGLHPVEKPFVMAHELAHGFGFGDEGTCNFLGLLACVNSDDPIIKYAGYLEYYSTLAVNLRRYDRESYYNSLRQLSPAVKADWNGMVENHQRYPAFMPKLRRATYDTYLKVQGISEGIQNYNTVLMLVRAWKTQHGSLEELN